MKKFGVNSRIIRLCEDLIAAGYTGTAELTRSYPSGARGIIGMDFSMKLSGFCKESLYLICDMSDDEIGLIGRYEVHSWLVNPTVSAIAKLAWDVYQSYKSQGYARPFEWEEVWIKEGFLKKEVTTVLVEQ